MFVSVLPGEQVEVVITEEGQVQEYYVEMLHQAKTKGNIYKGVVHNIDPNLQAAFIGYGAARNGFLQIDEIHPEYYVSPHDGSRGRKYPLIQKILKPGQEVLVQVVKEPAGSKGAFLTTYLAIPGRFLVLTPGREQVGVSRKVEDDGERARLRELLEGLNPGPGLGVIVRTVSMGAGKTNLQRDLQFLKRTWKEVRARGTSETSPCIVYQEMDLTARAVRDYLNESIEEVHIDDEETAATVTEVAEALFPRRKNLVRVYKDPGMGLFERFNIQRQLDQIHSREVTLPSGGRLVIDAAEALTAIDINSGRSGGKNNFEDLAYRTNMEAAAMIPLQLRLRDIGGQIVADFIEMRDRSHWREVEKTLRNGMKADRARYDVGKVSAFGLLEMVRQRLGSSAISVSTEPCPFCRGTGVRRNMEWRCQHALRDIRNLMRNAQSKNSDATEYNTEPELALHLLNRKRKLLTDLEQLYGVGLTITMRASEPGI
ncbi:MAG: Rne/Rng family ribonuclease [Desulfovibrio sp.]|nr:Rne/Rng family ribonuclease [Desulfovibrio sp.]